MTRNQRILILSSDAREYERLLCERGVGDEIVGSLERPAALTAQCAAADIVLGDPDRVAAVLDRLVNLEWVQSTWAGVKPLLDTESARAFRLTGVKGVFGPAIAEYVFCFALMHARRVREVLGARQWSPIQVERLHGQTMAILGVGSIGAQVARTAKHFGMHTVGLTRVSRGDQYIDRYCTTAELVDVIPGADYLVSILPDTPATTHLLNRDVFAAMKSTALVINVGRGNVIDDNALIDALVSGDLAAAVLDVFREEPLPEAHPFWSTPNLVITSHTAAVTLPEDIVPIFVDNLNRWRRGAPLNYLIDRERGY